MNGSKPMQQRLIPLYKKIPRKEAGQGTAPFPLAFIPVESDEDTADRAQPLE